MRKALGIDIGGTNLRVALVAGDGTVLKRVQHPSGGDWKERFFATLDELAAERPEAVGIASAGLIDRTSGTVTTSPNLPAVEGFDFAAAVRERYGLPVTVENDANMAAIGELYAGAGKGFSSFILLTLGTGIGGGIVHDGELLNVPAEIGHITVEAEGRTCDCGGRGCLEEYAAAKAMIRMATDALEKGEKSTLRDCCEGNFYRVTARMIHECALEGDSLSREILRTAGRYLGIGIANLANIFSPEAFILAGGLTNAWDLYVEEAVREADRRALKGLFRKESVIRSAVSEDAGLIGAALWGLHRAEG